MMESLETLQAINLAVQTLACIEELSIDENIKVQLTDKVLETIGIEKSQDKKYAPGSQDKIIATIKNLGGSATRADIASTTGMDPNAISSLLSKLSKRGTLKKVPLEQPSSRNGRGLEPEYIYKVVENGNEEG
jgi:predicted HTH transcriptional regulator